MKTEINNELIRTFKPCYDPSEIVSDENETLPVKEWIEKYRNAVNSQDDIIWLICRNDFMSDRDLRLFAVWCAREALKLVESPDERSVNACNVAERFANSEANRDELEAAWDAASAAASAAAWEAAWDAARAAACETASAAAWAAARAAACETASAAAWETASAAAWEAACEAAWEAQINKLLTYFID